MSIAKKYGLNIFIILILAGMIFLRLRAYGRFTLSVGNADTPSYIHEAAMPIFASDMFTRSRLFTTNLIYHLADVQDCKLQAVSHPALGMEIERAAQPCFNKIVIFQNVFSIFAWSILALTVGGRLRGAFEKILCVVLIPAFGFTPAIADWDSVLGSESLTFSLFAVSTALFVEFCFTLVDDRAGKKYTTAITILTIVSLFLWVFTRDANIYGLAVLFPIAIAVFLFHPNRRKNKHLIALTLAGFVFIIIGLKSAAGSDRWKMPLGNVFSEYILPYPARVDFMENLGMPHPEADSYTDWFNENGTRAYARFLLTHPGFAVTSFSSNLSGIFSENIQPYFFSDDTPLRKAMISANDLIHPNTHLVFLLDILLFMGLCFAVVRKKSITLITWTWMSAWLIASASIMLVVSFFADSIGITRHTLFPVELFRLMLWLFLVLLFDNTERSANL
ncbi:MAG: hypothetical protein HYZ23_05640 [Chloroflexi bacterium]|nr:hypothetical protein [Chloroflexota bacterium]